MSCTIDIDNMTIPFWCKAEHITPRIIIVSEAKKPKYNIERKDGKLYISKEKTFDDILIQIANKND